MNVFERRLSEMNREVEFVQSGHVVPLPQGLRKGGSLWFGEL